MLLDDINYIRDEIERHVIETPYGKALPLVWGAIKQAVDELEEHQSSSEPTG